MTDWAALGSILLPNLNAWLSIKTRAAEPTKVLLAMHTKAMPVALDDYPTFRAREHGLAGRWTGEISMILFTTATKNPDNFKRGRR